ncbi:MAG: hypothetical protein K2F85_06495, partial [Helicobacter sp.]|nr:hypothetical protein [Helicobacter sp.]
KEFTNPDGSLNAGDTQKIVVNTNSATLNINGAGGVDKFDIEASSFTKTLTIAGNLGTVPNYEEARNNYDTVRIDLSKTSGVNLDISRLLVSNPNDDGIQIVASKGADNITLVAGANHDVIEFNAGGGTSGQTEEYTLDLGTLRLGQGQSVTIDGLTITNISGFTNGGANVPNDDGIQIVASKGADNITLVAGANHDVIEFNAGGGTSGQTEEYTLDLGTLRLGQGQSVTIDGLTITNISGFTNGGANVNTTAVVLTAEDIATILAGYLSDGDLSVSGAFGGASNTAASKFVSVTGTLESLTTKNGWLTDTGLAKATASGTEVVITHQKQQSVTDIDLIANISGNGKTNGIGEQAGITPDFVKGQPETDAAVSGSAFSLIDVSGTASIADNSVVTLNGVAITFDAASSKAATANTVGTIIQSLVENGTTGTLPSGVTVAVAGITTLDSAAADAVKELFTLTEGYEWDFATAGKIGIKVTDTTTENTLSTTITQTTVTGTAPTDATFKGTAYSPEATGQIVIDFGDGLLAGQSYSFMGKTVLATKDLKGEDIAEAFAFGSQTSSGVDGAVVLGEWKLNFSAGGATAGTTSGILPAKCLFDIDADGKLIVMDSVAGAEAGLVGIDKIADNGNLRITGTGTLAVRTDKITGETTQQGQDDGEAIFADSYVTFAVLDAGSAGSGADAGTATKVSVNTSALDTITNFDVSTDKLLLRKFDASGAVGEKYANSDAFAGSKADALFVDTEGNTLSVGVANGIISFTTASSAEITLEQKLYAASVAFNAETNKIGGFAHNGDFYVFAAGSGDTSTTDDLVIKLAGVGGITDIGAILG